MFLAKLWLDSDFCSCVMVSHVSVADYSHCGILSHTKILVLTDLLFHHFHKTNLTLWKISSLFILGIRYLGKAWAKLCHATGELCQAQQQIYNRLAKKERNAAVTQSPYCVGYWIMECTLFFYMLLGCIYLFWEPFKDQKIFFFIIMNRDVKP